MAVIKSCAIGLCVVLGVLGGARGAATVELREGDPSGGTTRVQVVLNASGQYLPAPAPGAAKGEASRKFALKVELQLDYFERRLKGAGRGRAFRRVVRAASALNGEIRPMASAIRPEVALLVAEPSAEGVVVFSPGGPLTRSELELVEVPGDPLTLAGLLPDRAVKTGDRWVVSDAAARSLSTYDALIANKLEATLESFDDASARVRLRGEIRGSVLGGEGTLACDGSYTFDRKAARIDRLSVDRAETRRPGIVEEGLDVKSTLTVTCRPAETPEVLNDAAIARLTLDGAGRDRLVLKAPSGQYALEHDRNWHIFSDDRRLVVLKRVVNGKLVAQCNLAMGPSVGRGQHQDPGQFRSDVRTGLGPRFGNFLGAGEIDGDPAGGYRYKVGVQGRQDELGLVWYYYLIAGPGGDQLLATFTLAESQAQAFGNQDEALIGSLRWLDPPAEKTAADR